MVIYTAAIHDNRPTEPTVSSKRQWVPRRPPNFAFFGGRGDRRQKKIFGANAPTRSPKTCTKSPPMGGGLLVDALYKSTHLTLTLASKILERGGHKISVPSSLIANARGLHATRRLAWKLLRTIAEWASPTLPLNPPLPRAWLIDLLGFNGTFSFSTNRLCRALVSMLQWKKCN